LLVAAKRPYSLAMPPRDFLLLAFVCVVWATNNIVTKFVVSDLNVPPIFYAGLRFVLVALAASPWLLPMPRPRWRMVLVALLIGGGNFALVFMGMKTAAPSAVAVVSQVGLPITALLAYLMLGETITLRRGLGMALTLVGALAVMWDPRGFEASRGLLFIVASSFVGALGVMLMKQMQGLRPLQLQAWVGFSAILPLALLTAVFEHGQFESVEAGGWLFAAALLFSALVVSIVAHTVNYGLIQRYDANLVAALTVMTPLATIALGVALTGDPFGLRMALGSAAALIGVLIVAVRPNRLLSALAAARSRTG
jgi:drug/metabolite transporter (DMT)-like permease